MIRVEPAPSAVAQLQESKKHHYLPEFYLAAWCGADGRLERYVNRNGTIHTRRFPPGQVGYRNDLYRLLSATVTDRTVLERNHFEQLDSNAALAINRLRIDKSPRLSEVEKEAITRFVLSLPARSPSGIEMGQQIARETYGLVLSDEAHARDLGLPENRTVWKQIIEENPHFVADSTLIQMIEASTDDKYIARIMRMNWGVWDVTGSPIDLILSDKPFALHGSLTREQPDTAVTIPLSPTRFLTASVPKFTGMKPIDMVRMMNRQGAVQAVEHIFATDRKHLALAKARLIPLGSWKSVIKREP